jgi:aminodeoxyfutalosine deaminase
MTTTVLNTESMTSEWIRSLPKAELHVHLEGTTRPATLLMLAERHHRLDSLPAKNEADLGKWFVFTGFPHFVEIIQAVQSLILTPEDFTLVAYEYGREMARQNIRYAELTVTPYNHLVYFKKPMVIADLLGGLEAGRQQARKEFGVEMRWVFDIPRQLGFSKDEAHRYLPETAELTLEYALAGKDWGVVALGLGGSEVNCPPEPFAHAFAAAKRQGLGSVPHAGETVGPASVGGALHELQADRLGHGVRVIESPSLLVEVLDRQVTLEVCLSSNICLHVYPQLERHPLPHLDRMGLQVTLNSDDPPLFKTNLQREYELAAQVFGYDAKGLIRLARRGFSASLAEPELKKRMLQDFDAWAAGQGV